MDADLVHSASVRTTENHRRLAVVVEPAKLGQTLFALGGNFTDANLVADHLNGLLARDRLTANTGTRRR